MKNIIYLLILFLISCSENSQKISRNEIYYIEKDKETGWFRVLNTKNKWGFIDKDSIIKIPFEYDFVNPFEHQLAYVKNKGKEFYINPKNEIVIEGRFDKIDIFSEGSSLLVYFLCKKCVSLFAPIQNVNLLHADHSSRKTAHLDSGFCNIVVHIV